MGVTLSRKSEQKLFKIVSGAFALVLLAAIFSFSFCERADYCRDWEIERDFPKLVENVPLDSEGLGVVSIPKEVCEVSEEGCMSILWPFLALIISYIFILVWVSGQGRKKLRRIYTKEMLEIQLISQTAIFFIFLVYFIFEFANIWFL